MPPHNIQVNNLFQERTAAQTDSCWAQRTFRSEEKKERQHRILFEDVEMDVVSTRHATNKLDENSTKVKVKLIWLKWQPGRSFVFFGICNKLKGLAEFQLRIVEFRDSRKDPNKKNSNVHLNDSKFRGGLRRKRLCPYSTCHLSFATCFQCVRYVCWHI